MPVSSVVPDLSSRTLTLTADYPSPPEQVWQLWADPRLLERWWGPPTYPATVVEHDLRPGGTVRYRMTGPEGDTHAGWWQVLSVQPPEGLEFDDGFGEPGDAQATELPVTHSRVTLTATGAGTRMTIVSTFPTTEAMQQLIDMGMQEGLTQALGQADALLVSAVAS